MNQGMELTSEAAVRNVQAVLFGAYEAGTFPGAQALLMQQKLNARKPDTEFVPVELTEEEATILHWAASWLLGDGNQEQIHARSSYLGKTWHAYKPKVKPEKFDEKTKALIEEQVETETFFQAYMFFVRAKQAARGILRLMEATESE